MVLVFIESNDGKIKKSSLEAASYAAQTAKLLGTTASAIALGSHNSTELANLGNVGITNIMHDSNTMFDTFDSGAYTKAIAKAAESAQVVVISYNQNGKNIAPRVAVRLKAGLVPGANQLPSVDGGFKVHKSVFSGKAIAQFEITSAKKVIALNPNSIQVVNESGSAQVQSFDSGLSAADFKVKVKLVEKVTGTVPLTEAEIVVSAGRGMKGPENWGMIEELASLLGAATACSRPVADVHWRPHHEHVGQTGITVRPNLYFAIGISGAIQHLAGVNSSKKIVVINNDPEAPFFKAADYGIVGDAFEVLPKLIQAVKNFKASGN